MAELSHCHKSAIVFTIDSALTDHADDLAAGEFLVVTPGQIRVDGLYPYSLSALQSLMCCLSGR